MLKGMRYMLAMQCWKPLHILRTSNGASGSGDTRARASLHIPIVVLTHIETKAELGKKMPMNLPVRSRAMLPCQTARDTNQLQRIPASAMPLPSMGRHASQ